MKCFRKSAIGASDEHKIDDPVLSMVRSGDHLDGFSLLAAAAGVVLTNGRAQSLGAPEFISDNARYKQLLRFEHYVRNLQGLLRKK